jgi:prepilin-type processing-associated H-X9-DG protein
MKTARGGFTVIEMLVLVSLVLLIAALIVPALRLAAKEDAIKVCNSNLSQIARACVTYQEPNGDFFPAHSQYFFGAADDFKPMPSLAILYPAYLEEANWFGCPATTDKPFVSTRYHEGSRWACFGTDVLGRAATNPARYSGFELSTELKCSYFYDERTNFHKIGPGQAIACDADGQTWIRPDGSKPSYPANWTRAPRAPNHEGGQNVMYFDGHVKWSETAYASLDPDDNVFCPDGGPWDPDADAYLWDGVNARGMVLHLR